MSSQQGDARRHLVRRSGQGAQHAAGVIGVGGLAQQLAIKGHDGIGGDHDFAGFGMCSRHGCCLCFRQALDEL